MHVLFEDDGQLKAGTVLADHDQSLQVETVSGKRQKVKAANVLLRFAAPGPAETMSNAHALAGELDALAAKISMLLYRPDKNSLEWKALARACDALRRSPIEVLAACHAIPSTHDYHLNRFLVEAFPKGIDFPPALPITPAPELPHADVRAFSIDDASTTEIDDAFSVTRGSDGRLRVGIHIACPALAIPRGSAQDAIARERLSTV